MQDFINNLDWMMLLRAFIVGGAICIIGQILIDKTKLTPARILVTFVTIGAILGGLRYISKIS
jgi:stage V sporulation protein AE